MKSQLRVFSIEEKTKQTYPKHFIALMLPNILTNFIGMGLYASGNISAEVFGVSFLLSVALGPLCQFTTLKFLQHRLKTPSNILEFKPREKIQERKAA